MTGTGDNLYSAGGYKKPEKKPACVSQEVLGNDTMNAATALANYQNIGVQTGVEDATPHRLIQMLMQGFMERCTQAKYAMRKGDTEAKGERISKAIGIVEGLRGSLDFEQGGDLSQNLNDLYDYMSRQLLLANAKDDEAILDEVQSLMGTIKEGWDQIADSPEAS